MITHRAIEDNLVCVFIDDNFMRLNEPERVKLTLSSLPLNLPVKVLDEKNRFMEALKGLDDAEDKRKAFRETFYRTLGDAAEREQCRFLVQGTIKADVEETAGGIKTQHNVLEQIGIDPVERFGFNVIEPVASLYKYQVREVARYLGAPPEISERQPFPGPGLSVRVVGEITHEKLEELKKATVIIENGLESHSPDQYFGAIFSGKTSMAPRALTRNTAEALNIDESRIDASFLIEKATGIVDGERAYGNVAAIKVFDSSRGLLEMGYGELEAIRKAAQEGYPGITRVLVLVRSMDKGEYAIALRAIRTRDYITASLAEISWKTLSEVSNKVLDGCPKVSNVYFDLTPKPPGTIEFE